MKACDTFWRFPLLLLRGYNSNFAGVFCNISFAYFEDTPPDEYLSTPINPKIRASQKLSFHPDWPRKRAVL